MPPLPDDVTNLIRRSSSGDLDARARLFSSVYVELRRLARGVLRAERRDHTLQPTALVHEAYVRLAKSDSPCTSRSHFFGIAASAMRRILVDHARARDAQKRGGGLARLTLETLEQAGQDPCAGVDVLVLDDALTRLESLDPRQCEIVELRFFGGLSVEETATAMGVSERTVKRDWQMARAWLRREIARHADPPSGPKLGER